MENNIYICDKCGETTGSTHDVDGEKVIYDFDGHTHPDCGGEWFDVKKYSDKIAGEMGAKVEHIFPGSVEMFPGVSFDNGVSVEIDPDGPRYTVMEYGDIMDVFDNAKDTAKFCQNFYRESVFPGKAGGDIQLEESINE